MIEMRMLSRIELHGAAIVHAKRHAAFGDALDGAQLAVRDLKSLAGAVNWMRLP